VVGDPSAEEMAASYSVSISLVVVVCNRLPVQISESDRSEKREENKPAHIEEAAVTLGGEDEFGEVTGGFLGIVRCMLFQAEDLTQHHQQGSFQLLVGNHLSMKHSRLSMSGQPVRSVCPLTALSTCISIDTIILRNTQCARSDPQEEP
jgi:hypothetical protein